MYLHRHVYRCGYTYTYMHINTCIYIYIYTHYAFIIHAWSSLSTCRSRSLRRPPQVPPTRCASCARIWDAESSPKGFMYSPEGPSTQYLMEPGTGHGPIQRGFIGSPCKAYAWGWGIGTYSPKGPYTVHLRTLAPKAIPGMVFGTRVLKWTVYGPLG